MVNLKFSNLDIFNFLFYIYFLTNMHYTPESRGQATQPVSWKRNFPALLCLKKTVCHHNKFVHQGKLNPKKKKQLPFVYISSAICLWPLRGLKFFCQGREGERERVERRERNDKRLRRRGWSAWSKVAWEVSVRHWCNWLVPLALVLVLSFCISMLYYQHWCNLSTIYIYIIVFLCFIRIFPVPYFTNYDAYTNIYSTCICIVYVKTYMHLSIYVHDKDRQGPWGMKMKCAVSFLKTNQNTKKVWRTEICFVFSKAWMHMGCNEPHFNPAMLSICLCRRWWSERLPNWGS